MNAIDPYKPSQESPEGVLERQRIDCNCNDCIFMVRDSEKLGRSKAFHHQLDLDAFNRTQANLLKLANNARRENELERYEAIHVTRSKMKFAPAYVSGLSYGDCSKLNKPISFIANTCQPETQHCFLHRKDAPQGPRHS